MPLLYNILTVFMWSAFCVNCWQAHTPHNTFEVLNFLCMQNWPFIDLLSTFVMKNKNKPTPYSARGFEWVTLVFFLYCTYGEKESVQSCEKRSTPHNSIVCSWIVNWHYHVMVWDVCADMWCWALWPDVSILVSIYSRLLQKSCFFQM